MTNKPKLYLPSVLTDLNNYLTNGHNISSIAKYAINSAILEGINGYIKNMRRSSFGFSDFVFFGLLIWEHTHTKAKSKTEEADYVKKSYKPRSKPNSKKPQNRLFTSRREILMERSFQLKTTLKDLDPLFFAYERN